MDKINEKHLEFVQSNITRMNQCSFQMKGWAIAIVSALLAVFAATISETNVGNKMFIYIAIAPAFLFWVLDALYLSHERKFIGIYRDLITQQQDNIIVKDYDMPVKNYKGWKYCVVKAMLSPSESILYGVIICGLILFGVLY